MECFADIQEEDVEWLWPNRIPLGKLTVLIGDPCVGKSFLTMDIAGRISNGTPWYDTQDTPNRAGTVIILSAEDDAADTMKPRLRAHGADFRKVHVLHGVKRPESDDKDAIDSFSLERDIAVLEEAIARNPDTRCVIIDPVSAYMGEKVNTHRDSDVRRVLEPLSRLAARRRVSIVAVMHMRKGGSDKAVYRAMGSLAFVAAARMAWLVTRDAEDKELRLLLPVKCNLCETPEGLAFRIEEPGVLQWQAYTPTITADEAVEEQKPKRTSKRTLAVQWMREALKNGPVESDTLKAEAQRLGICWRTLCRGLDDVGNEIQPFKVVDGESTRYYWRLAGTLGE